MNINFKIYFQKEEKENNNNNVVLLKGDLSLFSWNSLKEKIMDNSNHIYFKNNNLELTNKDIIVLKIIKASEKYSLNNIKEIFDERTFDYLLKTLKDIKNKSKEESIMIKFLLIKDKVTPISNLSKLDIILNESLNNSWKKSKERMINELNEIELIKTNNDYINKLYLKKKLTSKLNKNVACNKCLNTNFFGPRYVCAYCNNFNLCYLCYKKFDHDPKHYFLIIKEPIKNEGKIILYNNNISPNIQYFNNKNSPFKVKFKLINTGENCLKGCFFNYIKFDENKLFCKKYEINEDIKRNDIKDIELEIFFDDTKNNYIVDFEGNFRMFNKYGIPFGDILIIKLHNDFINSI